MAHITCVDTAVPQNALRQSDAANVVSESLGLSNGRLAAVNELFRRAQVDQRYSVIDWRVPAEQRGLSQTMDLYRLHAAQLGAKVAGACIEKARVAPGDIDMIVTCSCTGLLLPSLSVLVAKQLGFRNNVRRLPITEAGCAGGASALARAHEFVRAFPRGRALILAVELPTLTLQRGDHSPSNLVASALFGDGAAAALVQGARVPRSGLESSAQIVASSCELLPGSIEDLGFDLKDGGLHVVLSRRVPELISLHLPRIVDAFLSEHNLSRSDLSFFVLHAGGRKILDSIEECLGLPAEATRVSRDVLREFGNQSSASVLFVLHETLVRGIPKGYGLLAAFGPGIAVELSLLVGESC